MNYITSHNFVRQNDKLCLLKKIRRSSNFFLIVNYKVSSRNEYISKRESLRTTTYQHCKHSVTATDHMIMIHITSKVRDGRGEVQDGCRYPACTVQGCQTSSDIGMQIINKPSLYYRSAKIKLL